MELGESWDGSESVAPPSTAWVGYDDEALYLAVKSPIAKAEALNYASHEWGVTDAMEIAIQDGFAEQPGPILNVYGWPDGHFVSTDQAGAPRKVVERLGKALSYKAAVGRDAWACEWRLPFAAMGFTPTDNPLLLLNVGVRKMADAAWTIWRGTGTATHVVANAGVLIFPDELLASDRPPREKLEVWLDASDADAIEKDEAGNVSLWKDKSGSDRHAVQKSPSFRPVYVPGGLNGKPALRFDEKRRTRMELPDLSDKKISATIFAVFSNPVQCSEVNHDQRIFTASDGNEYDFQTGLAATIPGMETGGPRQSVQTFVDRWAKHVRVGCFSPNHQTYLHGLLSEVLVYSRVMTKDEQDRVRAYLMLKWGLE